MSTKTKPYVPRVLIDERRFLRISGIPVCRVTPNGKLELKDKDGRRSQKRGSAFVEVGFDEIQTAVQQFFLES
jgi:hypothetical protein